MLGVVDAGERLFASYEEGAGPHAVTTAGSNTYTYDANGSMISGAGRTTTWTSFNKPQNISDSLTSNWTSFVYGPSRARIQQNAHTNGITTTTDYVGSSYERRSRLNQPDELVHYIRAGGGTVAIYTKTDDGNALTDKTRYLHKDHLGSVESITDEQGLVTEHLSYDAHGKRRQGDWNAGTPAIPSETPRGFTGHEHLDGVGLIHMNGRVYDPTLGRFLSADPNVQAPDDTQSFNRYSYVKNNPLSYTDPSGFFFKKIFKKIASVFKKAFKAVGNLIKKALQNQYIVAAIQIGINFIPGIGQLGAIGLAAVSAAFSGLVTLANGGDLGQALISAGVTFATAVAFHGVGKAFAKVDTSFFTTGHLAKTLAHGAVGGVSSKLRGGKFHTGFLSAAAAQFAAPGIDLIGEGDVNPGAIAARTAAAAVVGGAVAELGGGKFANGAVTGAMSRFFNDEQAEIQKHAARKAYNDLRDRYVNFAKANPSLDVDIPTAEGDLDILANHLRYEIQGMDKHPFMSARYKYQFDNADTFLWHESALEGRFFNINGNRHVAGDINYVAVGMLAAHYGQRSLIPSMVAAHNIRQTARGEGFHNLPQIITGTRWARYGAHRYRR